MDVKRKIINLHNYIADMSRYHIQNWIERTSEYDGTKKFVLMFHHVEESPTKEFDEYTITVLGFMDLVDTLISLDFEFCNVDDFIIGNGAKILLTFDDVYDEVYIKVFPFLRKKGIPFVVFQTYDFLDKEGFLSTGMIKEMLHYDKFFLGTHTLSHCNLHESKNYREEIIAPIEKFYNIFGRKPDMFAYPYGALITIDGRIVKCTKENYKYAFSTCRTYYRSVMGEKKYLIPRVNINESNYKFFLNCISK